MMINSFAWVATNSKKCSLEYLALHKCVSECLDTTVENAYTVKISLKVWYSEEKPSFSARLPLRCHIMKLATFSVNPGTLISLYESTYHPYTILATGEWMIHVSRPSEDSPVEVKSSECSHHLVFKLSSVDCTDLSLYFLHLFNSVSFFLLFWKVCSMSSFTPFLLSPGLNLHLVYSSCCLFSAHMIWWFLWNSTLYYTAAPSTRVRNS